MWNTWNPPLFLPSLWLLREFTCLVWWRYSSPILLQREFLSIFPKWRLILVKHVWPWDMTRTASGIVSGFAAGFVGDVSAWNLVFEYNSPNSSKFQVGREEKKKLKQVVWKKWIFKCLIQLETLKVYIDKDDNSLYYALISWHKHFVEVNVEFVGSSVNPPCWLNLFKELFWSPLNLNDFSRCTKVNNVKILLLQQKWFQLAGNWFCKSLVTAVFQFMWWLKK